MPGTHDRTRHRRAAAAAVGLLAALAACGEADGPSTLPSSTPSAEAPATPSSTPSSEGVLSGETDPGSVAVFEERALCVNASDYYYVLTSFSAAPSATTEPDAAFVRAAILRARTLADTLVRQLPPGQVANAEGAARTWRVVAREGRERGYRTDDLPAFFDDLASQVEDDVPGNAALTRYLSETCATEVPDFGTRLAPPT